MKNTPAAAPAQDFDTAFAEFSNADGPGTVAAIAVEQPAASEQPAAEAAEATQDTSTEPTAQAEPEDELTLLRRQVADLQHRERSASSRISSFHQKYNAAAAQVEELTRRLTAAAPNSAATESQPSTPEDEELAALSREMPEIGRMVDRLVDKKVGDVRNRVQQIETEVVVPKRERDIEEAKRAELEVVEAEYPNCHEIVASPEFEAWIAAKPPAIKAAWENAATGADGLEFLRMYDREVGAPAANQPARPAPVSAAEIKQRQLQRSVGLPSRAAVKPAGGMPPVDDFAANFAFFAAQPQH